MSLAITEQHKPKTQQVTPIFPIPTPNGTFTIQQPKQTPKELIQAQQITTKTNKTSKTKTKEHSPPILKQHIVLNVAQLKD